MGTSCCWKISHLLTGNGCLGDRVQDTVQSVPMPDCRESHGHRLTPASCAASFRFLIEESRDRLPPAALQLQPDMLLLLLLLLLLLWGPKRVDGRGYSNEEYLLQVPSQVTVEEGLCVRVPCKFSYPQDGWTYSDPVYGFWFSEGSNVFVMPPVATNKAERWGQRATKGRFHLVGDPQDKNCSLEIRDARKKDKQLYFFRVERGRIKWNYQEHVFVNVTALAHNPHIDVPDALEAGRPSNLSCSAPWACEWGPPPIFSWTGDSVTLLGPRTTHSSVLTLMPRLQDHGTNLTCRVTLPGSNVTRTTTIHLNVSYAPQNLTVTTWEAVGGAPMVLENGSALRIPEGKSLSLLCVADSNPPARLTWSWGNLSLGPLHPSNPGLLELSPLHLKVGGEITCQAENTAGSQHLSLSLAMQSNTTLSGVMWGFLVGSGTTALIFSFFCIILLSIRSWRKKSARTTAEGTDLGALKGSVSQSPLTESQRDDNSSHQSPTAMTSPSATEEEEVYYTSLTFHEMKPRDPQREQNTEYSEIKFNK